MILTRTEISESIKDNRLSFDPALDAFQLQPHAVDLRLGYTFYIPKSWELTNEGRKSLTIDYLDPKDKQNYFDVIQLEPGQYFEILPNESVIGITLERIEIKDLQLMAVLYPRSSFNRRGMSVSLTGIIDAGYNGHLMLPIHNQTTNHVIKIYPGERVCQVVFDQLASKLTKKDSQTHGLKRAKYIGSDPENVIYQDYKKKEASDEITLIREGKIQKLKKLYPL